MVPYIIIYYLSNSNTFYMDFQILPKVISKYSLAIV